MASIIAQLIASRRRLQENKKVWLPPNKSIYQLNSFDDNFSKEKHNKYLRNLSYFEKKRVAQSIAKGKKC